MLIILLNGYQTKVVHLTHVFSNEIQQENCPLNCIGQMTNVKMMSKSVSVLKWGLHFRFELCIYHENVENEKEEKKSRIS